MLREIPACQGWLRPIVLADTINPNEIFQALVVRKEAPTQLIFKSIRAVMAGKYWARHDGMAALLENCVRLRRWL